GSRGGTKRRIPCCRRRRKRREGGIRWRVEVNMKVIGRVVRIACLTRETNKSRGRAVGWQVSSVEIGRQKRIDRATQGSHWTGESSSLTYQHLCPVKGERLRTKISSARGIEHVHAHVVAVRPNTQVRVIKEIGAEMKSVAIVGARRISRS